MSITIRTEFLENTNYLVVFVGQAEAVLQPAPRIPPQSVTPKIQHTSKQEHTPNMVIQYKSRRLLMMDVLMSETC